MIPNFIAHKVYLGALPRDSVYSELFKLASGYGHVKSLKLFRSKGIHWDGYAIVSFREGGSAQRMLESRIVYRSCVLECKTTLPHADTDRSGSDALQRKIYIGGFDQGLSEDEIAALFSRFGKVQSVVINRESRSGMSKGSGFILFRQEMAATDCLATVKGYLDGQRFVVLPCFKRKEIQHLEHSDKNIPISNHLPIANTQTCQTVYSAMSNNYLRNIHQPQINIRFNIKLSNKIEAYVRN